MTLAQSTNTVGYVGAGNANVYSFPYPVFLASHLVVSVASPAGVASGLTLNTDYTVSGLSPNGSPAMPGSITLINNSQAWLTGNNLTTGWSLVITRVVPLIQNTSVRNQGDFYPATLEDAFDYLTMIAQQQSTGQLILTDVVTGHTYLLLMVSGVLSQQQLT